MAESKKAPEAQEAPGETTATIAPGDREKLNLEQKFVELRKAVPAIIQRQHSDGVKYKFAKIFDVYELLAPAMNAWGVNLDVVGETATRHYENGDPMYYTSYIQKTYKGERTVWLYEADLTLRWTNADKIIEDGDGVLPLYEHEEITLHALGTNDAGPDKAKGSAWTYCIKYYLFEKFNIDQGEDDPDNKDLSGDGFAPSQQSGQNARQSSETGQTKGNARTQGNDGQSGRKSGTGRLSAAQVNRLYKKAEAAGLSKERTDTRIIEKYNKKDPADLTRQQYDEICDALDAAAKGGDHHAE